MPRPPLGDRAMTGAERQRHYRLRLASVTKTKPNADAEARVSALEAKLAEAREAVLALKELLAIEREEHRRARAAARASQEELQMAKGELNRSRSPAAVGSDRGMSVEAHRAIIKALHPDSAPSEAERTAAAAALNAFWEHQKPARRR